MKPMSQAGLRLCIFFIWLSTWIVSFLLIFIAAVARKQVIDSDDIIPALTSVSVIFMPAISCFATFWFPRRQRAISKNVMIPDREKILGALALTTFYNLIVLGVLLWVLFFISGDPKMIGTGGDSLSEQLNTAVKFCVFLSSIALFPINALTDSDHPTTDHEKNKIHIPKASTAKGDGSVNAEKTAENDDQDDGDSDD